MSDKNIIMFTKYSYVLTTMRKIFLTSFLNQSDSKISEL